MHEDGKLCTEGPGAGCVLSSADTRHHQQSKAVLLLTLALNKKSKTEISPTAVLTPPLAPHPMAWVSKLCGGRPENHSGPWRGAQHPQETLVLQGQTRPVSLAGLPEQGRVWVHLWCKFKKGCSQRDICSGGWTGVHKGWVSRAFLRKAYP